MPSMMSYSRGDVVLVPFPFTDLSGRKKRPGVIISSDGYNKSQNDLIIAQISSQVTPLGADEYLIAEWKQAGLLFPSAVRPKIFTIEGSRVVKRLGQVPATEMQEIDDKLRSVMQL